MMYSPELHLSYFPLLPYHTLTGWINQCIGQDLIYDIYGIKSPSHQQYLEGLVFLNAMYSTSQNATWEQMHFLMYH